MPASVIQEMAERYCDSSIEVADDALRLRGYYLPWGTKRIAYEKIRKVERVPIGLLTGRARIWGTANPRYWANLDLRRATRRTAFLIDVGRRVRPFVTPTDPDAFQTALAAHTSAPVQLRRGRVIV